jgi:hypothetical protein
MQRIPPFVEASWNSNDRMIDELTANTSSRLTLGAHGPLEPMYYGTPFPARGQNPPLSQRRYENGDYSRVRMLLDMFSS